MKRILVYVHLAFASMALLSGCACLGVQPSDQLEERGEPVEFEAVHSGDQIVALLEDGRRVEGVVGTIWERAMMVGETKIWKHEVAHLSRAHSREGSSPARLLIVATLAATIAYLAWNLSNIGPMR